MHQNNWYTKLYTILESINMQETLDSNEIIDITIAQNRLMDNYSSRVGRVCQSKA